MLSRVADSLYWMSRYIERAEHTTRLLDVNLNLMLDESASSADHRWQRMLRALGSPKQVQWTGDPYALTQALFFDPGFAGSILSCVTAARENARHVREQISTEQWQRLNSLYLRLTRPEMGNDGIANYAQPQDSLGQVMNAVHQFQGVSDSTMSHGEGWHFIQVGRYIERASATALLLEAYHEDLWAFPDRMTEGNEYLEWMGLLRCATAFEAYCKVYTADVTPDRVLEFLLLDEEFPHSVRFSIDTMQRALDAIEGGGEGRSRAEPLHRLMGRLQSSLRYSSVEEIVAGDIVAYLRGIQRQCGDVHNMIYQLYIDYSIQAALAG
jgi:uncharacterized alpha-E superfamily protein